jgi:hypothetical protein
MMFMVVWRISAVEEISRDLLNPLPILAGPFPYSKLGLACLSVTGLDLARNAAQIPTTETSKHLKLHH